MGQDESTLGGSDVDRLRLLLNLAMQEQSFRQRPAGQTSQADHAWDPEDCSPNFTLKKNDCTAERNQSTSTSDMVRGKKGYTKGTHIWDILWKKEHRGSHAVIGVASYAAPLKCDGCSALLGSNDESLGWNIVDNVSLFNDCVINKYPDNSTEAPDIIRVILNMDEGTLCFKSGIDGTDYGLCLSGLRAFSRNGQKLYPAISATEGAQIGIKYLGSADAIHEAIGGSEDTGTSDMVFHSEVGANIELSSNRRTATRVRGHDNGVVMSSRPLKDDEYFEVKLDKTKPLPTQYVMDIGVTTHSPEKLNFPETMTDCTFGKTWMFCGERVVLNKTAIARASNLNLNELEERSTVGLMKKENGELHIFVNGDLKGKFALNIPSDVYAVVDLYGKGCQATITGRSSSSQSRANSTKPSAATGAKSPVEVVTEKLQAIIALMNNRDGSEIPSVHSAIHRNLLSVYSDMAKPAHRQMLGDRFSDMGGAKAITDYMIFLKDDGVKNEGVMRCTLDCFNVLLNFTHSSMEFARALGNTETFLMLLRQLEKLKTCYKSSKTSAKLVVYSIAVLHNSTKTAENVTVLRRIGAKDVFSQYCHPTKHEPSIAFVALLALLNITVDSEFQTLKVHDNMMEILVEYTAESVKRTENHSAQIVFTCAGLAFNVFSTEQVTALCSLSKNAASRVSLVKRNVTKHLVRLMEIGDKTEQELACNAVWELLSEQTVAGVIMCPNLSTVIAKLKDASVKEVADAAKRLFVKIEQVLLRSRGGATMQQVMPVTPTHSRSCEYKNACTRYLKHLGIREETWTTKWNACYCSDCHAKKEEDNYYTRGDPPKTYGIPRGWHRFGINVLPQKEHLFKKWHRAFHGTKVDKVKSILDIGELVMPGDNIRGGDKIAEREGHYTEDNKPTNFDTRQIFVSPSIRYAGHHSYATPAQYHDDETKKTYNSQVAFQLLIAPESYKVGAQTVGLTYDVDPSFSNQELEWATNERGSVLLYGLLVKLVVSQYVNVALMR